MDTSDASRAALRASYQTSPERQSQLIGAARSNGGDEAVARTRM